jgi:hypothetical protein
MIAVDVCRCGARTMHLVGKDAGMPVNIMRHKKVLRRMFGARTDHMTTATWQLARTPRTLDMVSDDVEWEGRRALLELDVGGIARGREGLGQCVVYERGACFDTENYIIVYMRWAGGTWPKS